MVWDGGTKRIGFRPVCSIYLWLKLCLAVGYELSNSFCCYLSMVLILESATGPLITWCYPRRQEANTKCAPSITSMEVGIPSEFD